MPVTEPNDATMTCRNSLIRHNRAPCRSSPPAGSQRRRRRCRPTGIASVPLPNQPIHWTNPTVPITRHPDSDAVRDSSNYTNQGLANASWNSAASRRSTSPSPSKSTHVQPESTSDDSGPAEHWSKARTSKRVTAPSSTQSPGECSNQKPPLRLNDALLDGPASN